MLTFFWRFFWGEEYLNNSFYELKHVIRLDSWYWTVQEHELQFSLTVLCIIFLCSISYWGRGKGRVAQCNKVFVLICNAFLRVVYLGLTTQKGAQTQNWSLLHSELLSGTWHTLNPPDKTKQKIKSENCHLKIKLTEGGNVFVSIEVPR